MKIDIDFKERIKIIFLFFLQFYKIVMGTMLSLFVSQKCLENDTPRVCTLSENLNTKDKYHQLALIINCLTLVMFLGLYKIELTRENYCIKHFDIDHSVADNNLVNVIDNIPDVKKNINKQNKYYYYYVLLLLTMYFINFMSSFGIVFDEDRRNGSTSYTGFLSFTLLVGSKLFDSYCISKNSYRKNIIQSSYLQEFSSFNILDVSTYSNRP